MTSIKKRYDYMPEKIERPVKETPDPTCACGHNNYAHMTYGGWMGLFIWFPRKKCQEWDCKCKKFRYMGHTFFDERYNQDFSRLQKEIRQ